jgi:hypothetical protein
MRLNDGLPVWHASVSVWNARTRRPLDRPLRAEAEAIKLLRGVGDPDREWWVWGLKLATNPWIGHLRVPVTPAEFEQVPPGCALHDAGEAGPLRRRRR